MSRSSVAPTLLLGFLVATLAGCSGSGASGRGSAASTAATAPGSTGPASTFPGSATPPGAAASPGSTVAPAPAASTAAGPSPTYGTRHCWPIVLVHGFPGWGKIGPVDYFYQVPDLLRANGFEVFVPQEKAISTVEERSKELRDQILAQYPDPRVKLNLIGHSMGGLDIRYMISVLGLGDRVASATTISTPHHGTVVADVLFGLAPGPVFAAANTLVNVVGYDLTGGKQLTTAYVQGTFNPQAPDDPRVAYFSWAGVADPTGSATSCVVEPFFLPTWAMLQGVEGPNDGLISVASATWGSFEGTIPADHWYEIGQPLGMTPAIFDHKKFYETWAEQLETRGFGP